MQTLIRAGRVLTMIAGETAAREGQGILINDGLVQAVDDWGQFAPADDVTVVDAARLTVLPGLIDAHTHIIHSGEPDDNWGTSILTETPASTALKAARHARQHLEMGVTTIRDMGSRDWVDIAVRNAINNGWHVGPRIVACGHGITTTGGHMDPRRYTRPGIPPELLGRHGSIADTPDEGRRAAMEQLMRGADFIKINLTISEYVRALGGRQSPEMTPAMVKAIVDVAHSVGRKVGAHCHGGEGVTYAVEMGVDTFEHGRFLTDEQMDAIIAAGKWVVPTLSPEARRKEMNLPIRNPGDQRWMALAESVTYQPVERAYRRGVALVAGTDAAMPGVRHGELYHEMALLAHAGMSHLDTLAAATRVAAEALGLGETVGQVRPGYVADLTLVEGDPLHSLECLAHKECVRLVVQAGNIVVDRRG